MAISNYFSFCSSTLAYKINQSDMLIPIAAGICVPSSKASYRTLTSNLFSKTEGHHFAFSDRLSGSLDFSTAPQGLNSQVKILNTLTFDFDSIGLMALLQSDLRFMLNFID
jgi:inner membrane protein involved in colicin E2 resistance